MLGESDLWSDQHLICNSNSQSSFIKILVTEKIHYTDLCYYN